MTVRVCVPASSTDADSASLFSWVSTSSVTSRVAVVVTDGNSNVDSSRTVPEAVALHQSGVHVITVSVGRMYNQSELRAIASLNGSVGKMFHADRNDQLETLSSSIQAAICNGRFCQRRKAQIPLRRLPRNFPCLVTGKKRENRRRPRQDTAKSATSRTDQRGCYGLVADLSRTSRGSRHNGIWA